MSKAKTEPGINLLKEGHIRPLGELIDEILLHAFDYYGGDTQMMSKHLKISKNSVNRKLKYGAQHKGWDVKRIDRRTTRTVRGSPKRRYRHHPRDTTGESCMTNTSTPFDAEN